VNGISRGGRVRLKTRKKWEKRQKTTMRRRKKDRGTVGGEPARLARQVQRARMQHYEDVNSHNYTWIVELRFRYVSCTREETHFLTIGILCTVSTDISTRR